MSQPKDNEIELSLSIQAADMTSPEEAVHVSIDFSTMHCQIGLGPDIADSPKTLGLLAFVCESMTAAIHAYQENPDQYKKEEA